METKDEWFTKPDDFKMLHIHTAAEERGKTGVSEVGRRYYNHVYRVGREGLLVSPAATEEEWLTESDELKVSHIHTTAEERGKTGVSEVGHRYSNNGCHEGREGLLGSPPVTEKEWFAKTDDFKAPHIHAAAEVRGKTGAS